MGKPFNYKHLYYFWVVAKEGGISKAAQRLDMAIQTVSAQVRELERDLGYALFKPAGRGLALTEAGQAALKVADQIFQLGETLPELVREAASQPSVRLVVGISDSLAKLVVHRLLQPVLDQADLRLVCLEGELDSLLADLALHKLDVVLSDRPAPTNPNIRLYSHALGSSDIGWYGSEQWHAQLEQNFPHSLAQVPLLLPTHHTAMRARLDWWLEEHGIAARVVGEFEDSALLKTFGSSGMGVFPAAQWAHDDLVQQFNVRWLGAADGVRENFYAIGTERKVQHPLVLRLLAGLG
ncbi:LysR family transcriptional regulator [Curvibacter sp. CHRR-16]|uniref:LysR family transcriptional regulator n=1 Tax=Curvibacter sp. CHRR-16 TaxID=2835872 RepID=UPI001BDA152E|nr:LysR family transcriptional regulator [Curvibacter sp. CHRR-16]MBT0570569.1 LysR family transcriptional regulator [Curvibacter sp. CHRR-16]